MSPPRFTPEFKDEAVRQIACKILIYMDYFFLKVAHNPLVAGSNPGRGANKKGLSSTFLRF